MTPGGLKHLLKAVNMKALSLSGRLDYLLTVAGMESLEGHPKLGELILGDRNRALETSISQHRVTGSVRLHTPTCGYIPTP